MDPESSSGSAKEICSNHHADLSAQRGMKIVQLYLYMLNHLSFPLDASLREESHRLVVSLWLVRNRSLFMSFRLVRYLTLRFEEGFQTSWNDKNNIGFWTDPRQGEDKSQNDIFWENAISCHYRV
jgi:hypothetical protein